MKLLSMSSWGKSDSATLGDVAECNPPLDATTRTGFSSPYSVYTLIVLMSVMACSYVDRTLIGVLAPLIKVDLKLTDTALGLLSGPAFATAYCLLALPVAWLADRYSRKWILVASLAIWSSATCAFGIARDFYALFVARILLGGAESGGATPAYSLISSYFPLHQRARAIAIHSFGAQVGIGGGTILCGAIASSFGWRMTFVFIGLFGLSLALLLVLTLREHSPRSALEPKVRPPGLLESLRIMFGRRSYVLLIAGTSAAAMAAYPQMLWAPSYFSRRFGLSVKEIALVFGTVSLAAGIGGGWLGGYLADRLARKSPSAHMWVPAILNIVAFTPFVLIFTAPTEATALASYFLATFITAGSGGPVMAATQNLAPPEIRSTSAAICSTLTQLVGTAVAVPLIGVLSDLLAPTYGKSALGLSMLTLPPLSFLAAVRGPQHARRGGW